MASTRFDELPWLKLAVAAAALLVGAALVFALVGTQVSGVLSTIGSSVSGGPYPGNDVSGGDTTGGTTTGGTTTGGDTAAGSGTAGVITAAPRDDLLIIKTGTMTLQVGAIGVEITSATNRIDALGGYASGSQSSGSGESAQATIAFRVPAARWDEAMNAVRGLAIEVLTEDSATEDVTSQVVDLGARIRNLQATERALQSIMDKATAIKDVLSVQAELTTVRGQIEQLTAEKAHLEERAAYSSLTVTFVLKPAPVLVEQQGQFDPASEVDAASASLVSVLQGVATAGIWFGIVWLPILIALGVATLIGALVVRRFRRSTTRELIGN